MSELEEYRRRINEISPEITVESLEINRDGLLNDVVVVNREFVFRFAKRDFFFKNLNEEAKILNLLADHITLEIPRPLYVSDETMAYRLIPGDPLRRDVLMRLSETDQQAVADQLAQFFKELHGIPVSDQIPAADALMKYDGWLKAYERIQDKVFPILMPHARDFVREHFENFLGDKSNFDYEAKWSTPMFRRITFFLTHTNEE